MEEAISFFTVWDVNKEKQEEIKRICIPAAQKTEINAEKLINMGYLSLSDFSHYALNKKLFSSIKARVVEVLIYELANQGLLNPLPYFMRQHVGEQRFSSTPRAQFLQDRRLIINAVCGWRYIIERYESLVLKIQNTNDNGDIDLGTGFYFAAGNENIRRQFIITNKHVVEKANEIKLFTKEDNHIFNSNILFDKSRDLAFIELDKPLYKEGFQFNPGRDILSEIITIGYPSVPMTKLAYQIYHKGEINSL